MIIDKIVFSRKEPPTPCLWLKPDEDKYELLVFNGEWVPVSAAASGDFYTKGEVNNLLSLKQDIIIDIASIREGAALGMTAYQKPEGGIPHADLSEAVNKDLLDGRNSYVSIIHDILPKIPTAASAVNQLADKKYVDDLISSELASYISNNGHPFTSLEQLEAYTGEKDNNDYAFVVSTDALGNTIYTRYKWVARDERWEEEYVLNNSSFTSVQWDAINSEITAELVDKLRNLPTASALTDALDDKQDKLTFDNVPTANSNNPVKSGGVYSELQKKQDKTLVEQVAFTAGQSTTKSIDPNKIYECTYVNVMSFAFNSTTVTNTEKCEYCIKFNVGATVPTLTLPNIIKWAEELELKANTHYVLLINYENGGYYGDWKGYEL